MYYVTQHNNMFHFSHKLESEIEFSFLFPLSENLDNKTLRHIFRQRLINLLRKWDVEFQLTVKDEGNAN